MAKAPIDIRSLARKHTKSAINTLHGIMTNADCTDGARVQAAQVLLDRGWGKPTQPIAGEDGKPINVIQRIELVGVSPTTADPK